MSIDINKQNQKNPTFYFCQIELSSTTLIISKEQYYMLYENIHHD